MSDDSPNNPGVQSDPPVTEPEQTYAPVAAARALKVRRETVHRWMRDGRLPFVMEANAQGRMVRRIPLSAIHAMRSDGVHESPFEVTESQSDHPVTITVPDPQQTERLLIAEKSIATLAAEKHANARTAAAALAEVESARRSSWFGRKRRLEQAAAAAEAALRALAHSEPEEPSEG